MKLSGSALKNANYKEFFINHGEKIAVVVVILGVAYALWGTRWSQFPRTPEELTTSAEKAKEAIIKQEFPKEKAKELEVGDGLRRKVVAAAKPVDATPYQWTAPLDKPLHPERKRIINPNWLPVEKLIADASVAMFEMEDTVPRLNDGFKRLKSKAAAAKKATPAAKKVAAAAEASPSDDPDFSPKVVATKQAGARSRKKDDSEAGIGAALKRGLADPKKKAALDAKMAEDAAKKKAAEEADASINARGFRFAAVRGVFPLHRQVQEVVRAGGDQIRVNQQTRPDSLVSIQDFTLERQTMSDSADPWSGPWEPVDVKAVETLMRDEIADIADDTIAMGINDHVICMPYPERLFGNWNDLAIHPDVKAWELPPDRVAAQADVHRRLLEKQLKEDAEKEKAAGPKKGGFAQLVDDPRESIRRATVNTGGRTVLDELLDEIRKGSLDAKSQEVTDRLAAFVKQTAEVQGNLLLFRFLDFTVQAGKTYRYRVKLKFVNPFYQRHQNEVVDPSIAQGETRESGWSEPSAPVHVQNDARYFVQRVDPGRGATLASAMLDLFQWFPSTGTIVNKPVRTAVGDFVGGGGKERAKVTRPAARTGESEIVPFATNAALVDIAPGGELDRGLHAELFSALAKAKPESKLAPVIPSQALVVNSDGKLVRIDGHDQQPDYASERTLYERQSKAFKFIDDEAKEAAEAEKDAKKKEKKDDDGGGRKSRK